MYGTIAEKKAVKSIFVTRALSGCGNNYEEKDLREVTVGIK
jgi:hypothetical protein